MLTTKLCTLWGIVAFAIASQATAVVIENTDVLGRPLQYNELDRELKLEASSGAADADVTKQHELCGQNVFEDEAGVTVRVACYFLQ